MDVKRLRPLAVGIILDMVDYGLIGLVPVAGDIVDIFGAAYFLLVEKQKLPTLLGATELIPAVDFLPMWTFAGFLTAKRMGEVEGGA
jgi:hypothetical protein